MDPNLPATRTDPRVASDGERPAPPLPRRQPLAVAFLPLALISFIVLAFVIATWTFLAAAS
jgi:hypothetical protein